MRPYSLLRLIRDELEQRAEPNAAPNATPERILSHRLANARSQRRENVSTPRGKYVPAWALHDHTVATPLHDDYAERDLDVVHTEHGGALVSEVHNVLGEPVEALRPRRWSMQAGVNWIDGLQGAGEVVLPVHSARHKARWVERGGSLPKLDTETANVAVWPHDVGCRTVVRRQFVRQASFAAEAWLRRVLRESLLDAAEAAILGGSGIDGEPLGLVNTPDVASVDFAVDGSPTRDELVDLHGKATAADANALNTVYVAPSVLATTLRKQATHVAQATDVASGRYVVERESAAGDIGAKTAPLVETNNCPADTVIAGDFGNAVVAMWADEYDVVVNPYGEHGPRGDVEVVMWLSLDVAFAQRGAFAVGK